MSFVEDDNANLSVSSASTAISSSVTAFTTTVGLVLKQRKVDLIVDGGSAAINGNIRLGDEVVQVDGVHVTNSSIVHAMKGDVGTKVRLTFRRPATGILYDAVLVRQLLWGNQINLNSTVIMQSLRAALESRRPEELQTFVANVSKQIASLEGQLSSWKAEAEHARERVAQLELANGAYCTHPSVSELEDKLKMMTIERDSLLVLKNERTTNFKEHETAVQAEISRVQAVCDSRIQELEAALRTWRARATSSESRLEEQSRALQLANTELQSRRAQDSDLEEALAASKEEVDKTRAGMNQQMHKLLEQLRSEQENARRQHDLASIAEKKQREMSSTITELKIQLESAHTRLEAASLELAKLKKEHRMLLDASSIRDDEVESKLQESNKRVEEFVIETQRLQEKMRLETEKSLQVERKYAEVSRQVSSMTLELQTAQASLSEMRQNSARVASEYKSERERLLDKIEKLEAQIRGDSQNLNDERMKLRERVAQLQKEVHILMAERDKVVTISEDKLRKASARVQELVVAKGVAEGRSQEQSETIERLVGELEALRASKASLRQNLYDAEKEHKAIHAEFSSKIASLSDQCEEYRRQISTLVETETRCTMMQQTLLKERNEHNSKISDMEEKLRQAVGSREASLSRVEELQKHISLTSDEISAMRAQIERLATEKGIAEGRVEQMRERVALTDSQLSDLRVKLSHAEKDSATNEERYNSVRSAAERDVRHVLEELESLRSSTSRDRELLQTNFDKIVEQLRIVEEQRQRDLQDFSSQIKQKETRASELQAQVEVFAERLRQQSDQIQSLNNTLRTQREALSDAERALGQHSLSQRSRFEFTTAETHTQLV